ncbi:bifunctional 4-hydroxy-2-oxoglutarate aldolase/2-dehydro-3-deoxy-phosphogluconate aldolase [Pontibacter sp. HSC-14F20]|uniref:bifunctional 4-hydroxy-2-oxoglutarate aldolase/2-dehydro-3-deoxy-phosphogluconate aldolase n=1 Tax=Pontibacter sp. HSC-14F20 TaxID=2864136 RepID=UPI001C72CEC0|nr:bifunctional 4-hydroxy-2-oxoglutarate aldolase/2-dehydro-3-deoxy-phosphogluconate aldolase [Pontibacter sp. HSC-14F20]MBX0335359.1 bifunctional 4-hydroxy-2-oxoglutarate aldolase/2-dehydro-3-deoxy-phosphogluconate aldolase [Pontibacter sp. HSC-14F20]
MNQAKQNALDKIFGTSVIPVYYHDDAKECLAVLEACYAGGMQVFEFTDRGNAALANFKVLKTAARDQYPDLKLGIGTIKNAKRAAEFITAGADFIVSPIMDQGIAETVHQHGLLWIPGCMTPTEIAQAEQAGATLVKLFPGNVLGASFVGAVKSLFPGISFMPTGGVAPTKESIQEWFTAGVKAVGLGSRLFEQDAQAGDGKEWLTERCRQVLQWAGQHQKQV